MAPDRCFACHVELGKRVQKEQGFHGHLKGAKLRCQNCHAEHQGRDTPLIEWVPSKKGFDHAQTGWPLVEKHHAVLCNDCHVQYLIKAMDVLEWLQKRPVGVVRTPMLGLSTGCQACHFDEHRGQLADHCDRCHDIKGWKPAPLFNHQKSDYPLTGKHTLVACAKCHPSKAEAPVKPNDSLPPVRGGEATQFKDIAHQSCLDCHKDPHDNRFGERCESCHVTAGWKTVKNLRGDRAFHASTRFPLQGLHEEVPCKSCHGPSPGKPARFKNLAFAECSDCHADAHEGQLTRIGTQRVLDCKTCHGVEGFRPVRFGLAAHAKTRYPLEGSHVAIACNQCHVPTVRLEMRVPAPVKAALRREKRKLLFSNALFDLPGAPWTCEACHLDPHAGQFTQGTAPKPCASCHQVKDFTALTFNHDRDSHFPLSGKHATTACGSCHTETRTGGSAAVKYRPLDVRCSSCHLDVHAGQFSKNAAAPDCASCHQTQSWKSLRFKHEAPFTGFVLSGKHAKVGCEGCHPAVVVPPRLASRKYVGVPTSCADCHQDFHRGEFSRFLP